MDNHIRIALLHVGDAFPDDGDPEKKLKYQLGDHLGSSNVVIGEDGVFINREQYYPYGETSFGSYAKKRYRFTGKERDEETGLYYYGARYFGAWLARWLSPDPGGLLDGLNPFSYARANPIRYSDITGFQSTVPTALEEQRQQSIPGEHPIIPATGPKVAPEQTKSAEHVEVGEGLWETAKSAVKEFVDIHPIETLKGMVKGVKENLGLILANPKVRTEPPSLEEQQKILAQWGQKPILPADRKKALENWPTRQDYQRAGQNIGADAFAVTVGVATESLAPARSNPSVPEPYEPPASAPVGHRGSTKTFDTPGNGQITVHYGGPLPERPPFQPKGNFETEIGGTPYSGHALDRMQQRGYTPTVVEEAIKPEYKVSTDPSGTSTYVDPVNGTKVIVLPNGKVKSVW
jgi:RHS repeat-associated protein